MPKVRLPNQKIVDVPDDIPDQEVKAYIHATYPEEFDTNKQQQLLEARSPQEYFEMNKGKGIQNIGSMGSDAIESAINTPSAFGEFLKSLPEEGNGALGQLAGDRFRFGKNLLAGGGNAIAGLLKTPKRWANYQEEHELIPRGAGDWVPEVPNVDFNKLLGIEGHQPGDDLLQGIGGFSPFARMGGGLAQNSAVGAMYSAANGGDPIQGALMPGMFKGIGKGLEYTGRGVNKVGGAINPVNRFNELFHSELEPEELMTNLRSAGESEIPLGKVLESPLLADVYDTYLPYIPGTGQVGTMSKLKKDIRNSSTELVESLRPENLKPNEDPQLAFKERFKEIEHKENKAKNALFNEANKIEKESGFQLETPSFDKFVEENAKAISESPFYKTNSTFRKSLNRLLGLSETVEEIPSELLGPNGKRLISNKNTSPVAHAQTIAHDLYKEGQKQSRGLMSADRHIGQMKMKAAELLRKDIKSEINKIGTPEHKAAYNIALKNYEENYTPHLDEEIWSLNNPGKSGQNVAREIIKLGKDADRFELIKKVQDLLPEEDKTLLLYSYLKSAQYKNSKKINPKKLDQLIEATGNRQFEELAGPHAERILDYVNKKRMGNEALDIMFNPKTGNRVSKARQAVSGLAQFGAMTPFIGPLAAAGVVGGESIAGRWINKAMTDPKFRKWIVEQQIKQKTKQPNKSAATDLSSYLGWE